MESPRLTAFNRLFHCPVRKKIVEQLSRKEVTDCIRFIASHDHLNYAEFSFELARWHLDIPERPKHWVSMWAAVSEANSILFKKRSRNVGQ